MWSAKTMKQITSAVMTSQEEMIQARKVQWGLCSSCTGSGGKTFVLSRATVILVEAALIKLGDLAVAGIDRDPAERYGVFTLESKEVVLNVGGDPC
jgi:hypothetical protein